MTISCRKSYRGERLPNGATLVTVHREVDVTINIARDGTVGRETAYERVLLDPAPSLNVRNHSPTGFEWGYNGSGPAQLSLAILLDFFGGCVPIAEVLYQFLKDAVTSRLPDSWELTGREVGAWVMQWTLRDDAFERIGMATTTFVQRELERTMRDAVHYDPAGEGD